MIFIISTLMLFLILVTKVFFIFFTKGNSPSLLEYTSVFILIVTILAGTIDYLKGNRTSKVKKHKQSTHVISIFLLVFSAIFILISFYINSNKKSVLWDAVALYDARAKYMMQGENFHQMVEFSKYDPENSYYYALYPPYTSILHYFWYSARIPAPVGVLYAVFLLLLVITVYKFAVRKLGRSAALLLTFLIVTNGVIFSSSLAEYTNLPFTLQMFLGTILLFEFLDDEKKWKFFYGGGLVVTSMWIRFLEPLWVGAVLALFIAIMIKEKLSKKLIIPLLIGIYGILEYASWQSFVSSFGELTKIINFSPITIFEPFVGLFTGTFISILIFFINSWGLILLVYIYVILLPVINRKKINFMQLFLLLIILIYFLGLYFVSFQSVWWKSLGDSLVRSSAFMIPISGYLLLEYLYDKKN